MSAASPGARPHQYQQQQQTMLPLHQSRRGSGSGGGGGVLTGFGDIAPTATGVVAVATAAVGGGEPAAVGVWDASVLQLLREAERVPFASLLRLDTRSGRILYAPRRAAAELDDEALMNGGPGRATSFDAAPIVDVLMYLANLPTQWTVASRSMRGQLAAYVAQWMCEDALADLALRAAIEASLGETAFVEALMDTALGVIGSWPHWTESAVRETEKSAGRSLLFAVQAVHLLLHRDQLLVEGGDSGTTQGGARIALKTKNGLGDLVDSLVTLLVVAGMGLLRNPSSDSVTWLTWMFADAEERALLVNGIGALIAALLHEPSSQISGQSAEAVVLVDHEAAGLVGKHRHVEQAISIVLALASATAGARSFLPPLPHPQVGAIASLERSTWPEIVVSLLGRELPGLPDAFESKELGVLFRNVEVTARDVVVDTRACAVSVPTTLPLSSSSWSSVPAQRDRHAVAIDSGGQRTNDCNAPFLATFAARSTRPGKRGRSATTTLSTDPGRMKLSREHRDSRLTALSKSLLSAPTAPVTADNVHPATVDLVNLEAALGLVDFLWSEGDPEIAAESDAVVNRRVAAPTTDFGGAFAPDEEHSRMLRSLSTIATTTASSQRVQYDGIRRLADEEPFIHVPDKIEIALASAAATRSSLQAYAYVAQRRQLRHEGPSSTVFSLGELIRTVAFSYVAAVRTQTQFSLRQVDAGVDCVPAEGLGAAFATVFRPEPRRPRFGRPAEQAPNPTFSGEVGPANESPWGQEASSSSTQDESTTVVSPASVADGTIASFCARSALGASSAAAHVAIARSVHRHARTLAATSA